jgi:SEC-C motif
MLSLQIELFSSRGSRVSCDRADCLASKSEYNKPRIGPPEVGPQRSHTITGFSGIFSPISIGQTAFLVPCRPPSRATLLVERSIVNSDELAHYSPDPSLTPRQHHVLSLLAVGLSFSAAAEGAGVHRNTITNWRREIPSFATAFEKAARDQARAFQEEALDAVPLATQVILAILNDPATPPALRLRAAGMILKMADIKSAAQEREVLIDLQTGIRTITEEPAPDPEKVARLRAEIESTRAQIRAELEKRCALESQIPAQSCTIPIRRAPEPGRNSLCPCGSGQKYKRCCAQLRTTAADLPATASQTRAA